MEIAQTIAAQSPLGVQATLASAQLARVEGELVALRRLLPDLFLSWTAKMQRRGLKPFRGTTATEVQRPLDFIPRTVADILAVAAMTMNCLPFTS